MLPLYSISRTGTAEPLTTPQQFGYSDAEAARELVVEALRAYRFQPNETKSYYPKTADRLAYAVNTNPILNRLIHLNSLLIGIGGAGLGADAIFGDEEKTERGTRR